VKRWQIAPEWSADAAASRFASLDEVFALDGEIVAKSPTSQVVRMQFGTRDFYVKRYIGHGKSPLRRLLDHPRVQAEWRNLQRFSAWGIATAPLVAYGLESRHGRFVRGALITAGVPNTADLKRLALTADARFKSRPWRDGISQQLAEATRTMHAHGFAHNDLKWRNLLVDAAGKLYFIDCPSGGFWHGPFLRYRIVKDLACLDKMAKYHLSRTDRLRFYLDYAGKRRLGDADKKIVRKIVRFFEGRE
jgi:tRNA A-37 threonylcarbamoyl transferase component Bud32